MPNCHFANVCKIFFLALLILAPVQGSAELSLQSLGADGASPVTTQPARTVLIAGTALTLFFIATQSSIEDPIQRNTANARPLGKYSVWGDRAGQMYPNALYALGFGVSGLFGNSKSWKRVEEMVIASLFSGAWAQLLKFTVKEPRPNNGSNHASFPSGHACTIFAFSAVVGAEHGWAWGVPAYLLAAFTGYSRMNDNVHRLHDVIAGATIGMVYGLGVYYRREAKAEQSTEILPIIDKNAAGLFLSRRF